MECFRIKKCIETKKEIADRKREYIENAPQYPYRVVKKRVRKSIQ